MVKSNNYEPTHSWPIMDKNLKGALSQMASLISKFCTIPIVTCTKVSDFVVDFHGLEKTVFPT